MYPTHFRREERKERQKEEVGKGKSDRIIEFGVLREFHSLLHVKKQRFRELQLSEAADPSWKLEPTCFDSFGLRML